MTHKPNRRDSPEASSDEIEITPAMLAAGAVTALFAILFLLLTLVYALADVMPMWAAALVVGVALAISAGVMLTAGLKSCKLTPDRQENTVQEESHEPNNARNKVSH